MKDDKMKIRENQKVTLTIGQLKKFINESTSIEDFKIRKGELVKYLGDGGDVIIPDKVKSIRNNAFYNCANLTSITIPNSVTSIGERAFYGCNGLTSVMIPGSVTSIGDSAFGYCHGLKSVTMGNGVKSIGYNAFWWCEELTSVTIPASVTNIKGQVFGGCNKIKSFTVDPGNPNYKSVDGSLLSKDGKSLFCAVNGNLTIPDGVTEIGEYAFFHCNKLISVAIPNSVTKIGWGAFCRCYNLTSITLSDGVTEIGGDTFDECPKLGFVYNNSKTVIWHAPESYKGHFDIPDGVVKIEQNAFKRCKQLTSVTIPKSLTAIGYGAFTACHGLTSITIPSNVERIDQYAFHVCENLESVKILNPKVFKAVLQNPEFSFEGTPWAEKVKNGDILFDISDKETLDKYNGQDDSVVIPDKVKIIGADAFSNNATLTSVIIPDSVYAIKPGAFEGCENLKAVRLGAGIRKIEKDAFKGVPNNIIVYVPSFSYCEFLIDSGLPDDATIIVKHGGKQFSTRFSGIDD